MARIEQLDRDDRRLATHRIEGPHAKPSRLRICRVEQFEPRFVMTSAVHVGAVYYEPASGLDDAPNLIQITFEGGAAGTELTHLVIDGNKDGGPLTFNDAIFDTAAGGLGAYGFSPLTIVSHDGFQVTGAHADDGGTRMTLDFSGFRAGMTLVLSIDVDQVLFIDTAGGTGDVDVDAVDEGAEFQRSHFVTTFAAPHYEDLTTSTLFWDAFDDDFQAADLAAGTPLDLPPDRYTDEEDHSVLTAGAVAVGQQRALPSSLAGAVFYDANLDNQRSPSELGIAGVTLSLDRFDGVGYVATGQAATTDGQGNYRFDLLEPGEYRIRELQPTGYFSVGARAGTVNGQTRGVATSGDVVTDIVLDGGDNSLGNNFAEAIPNSLAGHVGLAVEGLCGTPDTPPIAGVIIQLLDAHGNVVRTATTDAEGNYRFDDLMPGTYGIREVQPTGYFDAATHAGTAGGTVSNNLITDIVLSTGVDGVNYTFCELEPASIAGFVYRDLNNNGRKDAGETGIAGVQVALVDAAGTPTGATLLTDAQGYYRFAGLRPGTYGVRETQPAGYLDGIDSAGTAGGVAQNPGDQILGAVLTSGLDATDYDFGELPTASLCGFVYADTNANGVRDPGEAGIAGVTLELVNANGQSLGVTVQSDSQGYYCFANLAPATYGIRERQPTGYFDGVDQAGTAGGTAHNPGDLITDIALSAAADADDYNFGELLPASLSGNVFQDGPPINVANPNEVPNVPALRDGKLTADDTPLVGVMLQLVDGVTGVPIDGSVAIAGTYTAGQPITATTDIHGHYVFRGLPRGTYGVAIVAPAGYLSGIDSAGSAGGVVLSRWTTVDPEVLDALTTMPAGDAILRVPLGVGADSVENNFSVVQTVAEEVQVFVFPQAPVTAVPVGSPLAFAALDAPIGLLSNSSMLVSPFVRTPIGSLFTWHLSVLDAGQPRSVESLAGSVQLTALVPMDAQFWDSMALSEGEWILPGVAGGRVRRIFGVRGGAPVTGDFNGDGVTDLGVFKDGHWYIDLNGNGTWDSGDLWAQLGSRGDMPVTGDWDGDGKTDIGIYGRAWPRDPSAVAHEPGLPDPHNRQRGKPKNVPKPAEHNALGQRKLQRTSQGVSREDMVDHVFLYGLPGDRPVVGDWNGDGVHTISVFRDGSWHRDVDGDGKQSDADLHDRLGRRGDVPIVGDFDGDGIDERGVFRNGVWYIDMNANGRVDAGDRVFKLGAAGDRPVVGDWDGDGKADGGIYRELPTAHAPRSAAK